VRNFRSHDSGALAEHQFLHRVAGLGERNTLEVLEIRDPVLFRVQDQSGIGVRFGLDVVRNNGQCAKQLLSPRLFILDFCMFPCSSDYIFTLPFPVRGWAFVGGLSFPHRLVVRASQTLWLSPYVLRLLRDCPFWSFPV
jgi:hypothetical protein